MIDAVVRYLNKNNLQVDEIVIQQFGETAIVHTRRQTSDGPVMEQVNWDIPGVPPEEYQEYGHRLYRFEGPSERQELRARLLARALGKPGKPIRIIKGEL